MTAEPGEADLALFLEQFHLFEAIRHVPVARFGSVVCLVGQHQDVKVVGLPELQPLVHPLADDRAIGRDAFHLVAESRTDNHAVAGIEPLDYLSRRRVLFDGRARVEQVDAHVQADRNHAGRFVERRFPHAHPFRPEHGHRPSYARRNRFRTPAGLSCRAFSASQPPAPRHRSVAAPLLQAGGSGHQGTGQGPSRRSLTDALKEIPASSPMVVWLVSCVPSPQVETREPTDETNSWERRWQCRTLFTRSGCDKLG